MARRQTTMPPTPLHQKRFTPSLVYQPKRHKSEQGIYHTNNHSLAKGGIYSEADAFKDFRGIINNDIDADGLKKTRPAQPTLTIRIMTARKSFTSRIQNFAFLYYMQNDCRFFVVYCKKY